MLGIHLPYVIQVANALEPLGNLKEEEATLASIWWTLYNAHANLHAFTQASVYAPYLRTSYAHSQELLKLLHGWVEKELKDDPKIDNWSVWQIKEKWKTYRVVFLADLATIEAYFIVQQGGFDTRTLTQSGENTFPSEMIAKVPETLFDAREATKCLAYAVPTAAGFHIFRILEAVIRKYYAVVTGGKAPPKVRSIGVYLNALTQAKAGSPIVLAVLKQIADLHRNPLIHPEVALTMDEALAAHGIVRGAVQAMLGSIPVAPSTTSNPSLISGGV